LPAGVRIDDQSAREQSLRILPRAPLSLLIPSILKMAKTIPFPIGRVAQAGNAKARLLPMPRATADRLALQAHLALDLLRRGRGRLGDAQALLQALILVGILAERGYGCLDFAAYKKADDVIGRCFDRGRSTNEWSLDDGGVISIARIVTLYDEQLCGAPLIALAQASDQLDRMRARQRREEPVSKSA
jgi:hypothetical protein